MVSFSFTPGPWAPQSSKAVAVLLLFSSCISSATLGYDGSMMNSLNILPSYTSYFELTSATLALNTASVYIGQCISSPLTGWWSDQYGRKNAIAVSALVTIMAAILQASSQNTEMFAASRIILGIGNGGTSIAGPVWLSECLPHRWRAWGLGLFYNFWYVGSLISAGITYGTAKMDSTWAWRLPSGIQGIFSIICIALLPFVPESPRCAYQDRLDEAIGAVAITHSDGERNDSVTLVQFQEIIDTLGREKSIATLGVKETFRTPVNRRRLMLAISVAVFTMLSGNNIVSYYLGNMLTQAGITNTTTQLEINIILQAWCLVIALIGICFMDVVGRRSMAIISTASLIVFLSIFGGLDKAYGTSGNISGIYGSVAIIFLFQGSYCFGWTPLSVLYPPEALHYSMRAHGMSIYCFVCNALGLFVTMVFPLALDAISYKIYFINAGWDVLELAFVFFCWVETRNLSLEELDSLFDGQKHSDVSDVDTVLKAKTARMDVEVLHGQPVAIDETTIIVGAKE
ncbi:MFS sugar transporter-like protein [Delphinella strobiligena]|nr:MFS sugar transporter-like protein [Delphinella strobiligena]